MVEVIGNLLYHFRDILIKRIGEKEFKKLLGYLKEDTRKVFEGVIISGDWYDLEIYKEILKAFLKYNNKEKLEQIIEELAENQLSGFFGFLVKLISPEKVMNKAQFMWNKAYSEGKVEKADMTEHEFILQITNFRYSEEHLLATTPYFRRWLEIILKKKVHGRHKRINDITTEFTYSF